MPPSLTREEIIEAIRSSRHPNFARLPYALREAANEFETIAAQLRTIADRCEAATDITARIEAAADVVMASERFETAMQSALAKSGL